MAPHVVSNLVVLGLVVGAGLTWRAVRGSDLWREAGQWQWSQKLGFPSGRDDDR